MNSKNIIAAITVGLMLASSTIPAYSFSKANISKDVKVIPYKAGPKISTQSGFKISQYDKINSCAWINDTELLILASPIITYKYTISNQLSKIKKAPVKPITFFYYKYSFGIYNTTTGTTKEFKNTSVTDFMGLSPDKRYVLYQEPNYTKKDLVSGGPMKHSVKILDLKTGLITTKKRYYRSNAYHRWIAGNKIATLYSDKLKWQITDVNGHIYHTGSIKCANNEYPNLIGEATKGSNNKLSGVLYFELIKSRRGGVNTKIVSVDINTNKIKTISNKSDYYVFMNQGDTTLLQTYDKHDNVILQWLNTEGKLKKSYSIGKATTNYGSVAELSSISPYSSIVAITSRNYRSISDGKHWSGKIKLLNLNTGETRDVLNCGLGSSFSWGPDGKSLSFTSKTSYDSKATTYVIKFN